MARHVRPNNRSPRPCIRLRATPPSMLVLQRFLAKFGHSKLQRHRWTRNRGEPLRLKPYPRVDGRTRLRNVTNCGTLRNRTRARSPLLSPRNCLLRAEPNRRDGFSINHRPNQLRRTLYRNEFGEGIGMPKGTARATTLTNSSLSRFPPLPSTPCPIARPCSRLRTGLSSALAIDHRNEIHRPRKCCASAAAFLS